MRTITIRLFFWGVLLLFPFRPDAFCQLEDLPEEAPPRTTTRVAFEDFNATPGMSFSIPIYFTPEDGVEVGRLKVELGFISENLKFVKLDRGIVAELGDLDLKSELKAGKNDNGIETSTLTITASFPSPDTAENGIHEGVLGYLVFRVDENGRAANIKLRASGEAAELKTNKPLQNFEAADATVDVFAAGDRPVVSCFFFTH